MSYYYNIVVIIVFIFYTIVNHTCIYNICAAKEKTGQDILYFLNALIVFWIISLKSSNGTGWYVLQTNYDPWKAPLFIDDRRTPVMSNIDKLGISNIMGLVSHQCIDQYWHCQKFINYVSVCSCTGIEWDKLQSCYESS